MDFNFDESFVGQMQQKGLFAAGTGCCWENSSDDQPEVRNWAEKEREADRLWKSKQNKTKHNPPPKQTKNQGTGGLQAVSEKGC